MTARITNFYEDKRGTSTHKLVECGWQVVLADDGTRLLNLNTYGSSDRKMPGKLSQSVQLDEAAACELVGILQKVFRL